MELRHLRYFVVLADELHFGRAAARLHISQPPLSFNIKQLEGSLGVKLLERNSHGVKLTPAGEAFRRSSLQLLAEAEQAQRRARDVASGVTSRVRIGFVGSMLFRGLPEKLVVFSTDNAQVQIELTELNSAEQLEAFGRGQIDLGFVHTPRVHADLSKALYMSEAFVLCTPSVWPRKAKATIQKHVGREPLVLFSRGASPDYYERVLNLCTQLGLEPQVRHEVRHWLSVLALVSKGMGYALVPQAMTESGFSGVRFTPLPESPIRSDVYMVWNERKMPAILPRMIASLRTQGG